jgi:hypothetical protein
MQSLFIAPQEAAPRLVQVNRGLITHERVVLNDPADRDLMPANFFNMFGLSGFDFPTIPMPNPLWVRRIEKLSSYDTSFERLMADSRVAARAGLLSVESCCSKDVENIVLVHSGRDFVPDQKVVIPAYFALASDPDFLLGAVKDDGLIKALQPKQIAKLGSGFYDADVMFSDAFDAAEKVVLARIRKGRNWRRLLVVGLRQLLKLLFIALAKGIYLNLRGSDSRKFL